MRKYFPDGKLNRVYGIPTIHLKNTKHPQFRIRETRSNKQCKINKHSTATRRQNPSPHLLVSIVRSSLVGLLLIPPGQDPRHANCSSRVVNSVPGGGRSSGMITEYRPLGDRSYLAFW